MYDCVVPGCKAKGVHNFPKNEQLRQLWEIVSKTNESKIYSTTRTCKICSAHFKPSDYFKEGFYTGVKNKKRVLKKSVIPSRFPWNTTKKIILKKMGIYKETPQNKAIETKSEEKKEDGSTSCVEQNPDKNIEKMGENASTGSELNVVLINMETSEIVYSENSAHIEDVEKMDVDTSTISAVSQTEDKKEEEKETSQAVPENQDKSPNKIEDTPKVPEYSQTQIIVKITPDQILEALQTEAKQDKTELRLIKQRNKQLLSMEHLRNDTSKIFARTGMDSFEKLIGVFQTLGPEVYFLQSRRNVICAVDQFLLTLIKLRQNKSDEQLAKLFSITPAIAKNIFITWIDFLYEKWKLINLSPENVEVLISPHDFNMPLQQNDSQETGKKGKKGKSKKKPAKTVKLPEVPEIIPEEISKTFVILISTENMKHVSRPKLYLRFSCSSSPDAEFSLKQSDCEWEALQLQAATPHTLSTSTKSSWRRAVGSQWRPQSGCHYHCISGGVGVRLVRGATVPTTTIQLCRDNSKNEMGCTQRKSPYQYATMVCSKYKERVRRLSGLGMQISPVLEDPDRPCRIACQDERVAHRFYLVNGQEGWFPLGTACGKGGVTYCISGKCLEFGPDNTPLSESVFTLPLLSRYNTSVSLSSRHRRSLARDRVTVKATLQDQHLNDIIARLNLTNNVNEHVTYFDAIPEHIEVDFSNPIHIAPEDTFIKKPPRPTWD